MEFDEIKDALNALKRGESIIVVDDEDALKMKEIL